MPRMSQEAQAAQEALKEPKPKNLKEVPRYVKNVLGHTLSRLGYIFRLVYEARPSLLVVMLLMTVYNGVMPLVGTLISSRLLSQVVLSFSQEVDLLPPLALQFGYIFFNSLVGSLDNMFTRISGELVTNHIKIKIMEKAKEVDLASFDMPDFYARLENASREAGSRPVSILSSAFGLVSKLISMISYVAVLAALLQRLGPGAYLLFVAFVALSVLSALISFSYRRKTVFYQRHRSKDRRELDYYSSLLTNKDVVKEIKLFSLADLFIGRYNEIFTRYFSGIRRLIREEGAWNIVLSAATAVLNGALFYQIARNVAAIGDYSVYTSALNAISAAVTALIVSSSGIYEGSLFIDNFILFMEEKRGIVPLLDLPLLPERHVGHTIELRDVSFAYPGTTRRVIDHLNLTIQAGETIALVGLNGSGKTTLIKLITRLYDPTEGVILLDGRDIREYDVEALYALYGIIFQDFGKYAPSVTENVAFGEVGKAVDAGAVQEAAEQSGADSFIQALPRGYDTPLMRYFEPTGVELSVGQWQKLSVARAFYADADILILDEPTASLDAIAEQEIFSQFEALRKDKTTVFVSHRLSSATIADRIVVLKDGVIAESGTHRELMAAGGEYYTLFSTQAKRYLENSEEIEEENAGQRSHGGKRPALAEA